MMLFWRMTVLLIVLFLTTVLLLTIVLSTLVTGRLTTTGRLTVNVGIVDDGTVRWSA